MMKMGLNFDASLPASAAATIYVAALYSACFALHAAPPLGPAPGATPATAARARSGVQIQRPARPPGRRGRALRDRLQDDLADLAVCFCGLHGVRSGARRVYRPAAARGCGGCAGSRGQGHVVPRCGAERARLRRRPMSSARAQRALLLRHRVEPEGSRRGRQDVQLFGRRRGPGLQLAGRRGDAPRGVERGAQQCHAGLHFLNGVVKCASTCTTNTFTCTRRIFARPGAKCAGDAGAFIRSSTASACGRSSPPPRTIERRHFHGHGLRVCRPLLRGLGLSFANLQVCWWKRARRSSRHDPNVTRSWV